MHYKSIHKQKYQGFTLVELMVTIAVAAILASLAAPSFNKQILKWDINSCAQDVLSELKEAKITSTGIKDSANGISVTVNTNNCADHVQMEVTGSVTTSEEMIFVNRQFFKKDGMNPMAGVSYSFYSNKLEESQRSSTARSVVISFNQEPTLWQKEVKL